MSGERERQGGREKERAEGQREETVKAGNIERKEKTKQKTEKGKLQIINEATNERASESAS